MPESVSITHNVNPETMDFPIGRTYVTLLRDDFNDKGLEGLEAKLNYTSGVTLNRLK